MTGVYDGRMPPFMWQSVNAMRTLRGEYVKANERKAAVAIYQSMTEAANDARSREFEAPRKRIAELAGCSVDTVDRYARRFVELGLLEVRQQRQGSVNLPNVWVLLEPDPVASPAAPPGRTPEATPPPSRAATPSRTPEAPLEEGVKNRKEDDQEEPAREPDGWLVTPNPGTPMLLDVQPVGATKDAEVLKVLGGVRRQQGSPAPTLEAIRKVRERYPDLDLLLVARELEFWAAHGSGARRTIKSVMGTFATFARRAQEDREQRGASQNGGKRVVSGGEAGQQQGWSREDW